MGSPFRASQSRWRGEGLAPNQIIITLPEWAMEGGVAAQAEHAGMTVEDWINQEVNGYFENYFSQAPQR